MLHSNDREVNRLLFKGNFGLEKESLRITREGYLSHTDHPFPNHAHIVRDFCENQTEINTPVCASADAAVDSILKYTREIQETLKYLPEPELLWPFSNPPYIRSESDIPIAKFYGEQASKTAYREYLSDRYGRYKMTFSGIHINFSFADELLEADYKLSDFSSFQDYKNNLYLSVAERAVAYGWLMVSITAASPVMDSSFIEKGCTGRDNFSGMASVRCSELGYWNVFPPVFDYSNINAYCDSMERYVRDGWISAPSELYYPVRLKPRGENNLTSLRKNGVNHIELRMVDLNPLRPAGLELKDVQFAHLLLIWLASSPRQPFSERDQVQAVQNFKNAAHYDLETVKIVVPNGEVYTVTQAALNVLDFMQDFYQDASPEILNVLDFQRQKFLNPENRYAWQVRRNFGDGFVKKGLVYATLQHDRNLRS